MKLLTKLRAQRNYSLESWTQRNSLSLGLLCAPFIFLRLLQYEPTDVMKWE